MQTNSNVIYGELKLNKPLPEDYHLELLGDTPAFSEDHIAWSVYSRKDDDPVLLQLKNDIHEYNSIVKAILDTPGFFDFFVKNELVLTKEQITKQFSKELADKIFELKDYSFVHQLHIYENQLFDIASQRIIDYKINTSEHSLIIENLSEDERDVAYYLCVQFEKDRLMPEDIYSKPDAAGNSDILSDNMYEWFECYDQARDDIEQPDGRVLRVIDLLAEKGYLTVYSIQSKEKHPSLCLKYPYNGSFDVYVFNLDYINDSLLIEQIKDFLKPGVFGSNSGQVSSYALISNYTVSESEVQNIVRKEGGIYIDLNEEEPFGVVFNVDSKQMKQISQNIGCKMFIWGLDYSPSTPELYIEQKDGEYNSSPISENVSVMDDLEEIAPKYSDMWENLYFNDYFRECIWSTFGSF